MYLSTTGRCGSCSLSRIPMRRKVQFPHWMKVNDSETCEKVSLKRRSCECTVPTYHGDPAIAHHSKVGILKGFRLRKHRLRSGTSDDSEVDAISELDVKMQKGSFESIFRSAEKSDRSQNDAFFESDVKMQNATEDTYEPNLLSQDSEVGAVSESDAKMPIVAEDAFEPTLRSAEISDKSKVDAYFESFETQKVAKEATMLYVVKSDDSEISTTFITDKEFQNVEDTFENSLMIGDIDSGIQEISESDVEMQKAAEDAFETTSLSVESCYDSEIEDLFESDDEIYDSEENFESMFSDSDMVFTKDSDRKCFQEKDYPLAANIQKSLSTMISAVNSKKRKYNLLLKLVGEGLNNFYRGDEYYITDEKKEYFSIDELLSKPDLDFDKLGELPFNFRTSLVIIRFLSGKMNDCLKKFQYQHDAILAVMIQEIMNETLTDKTSFNQKLSGDLFRMNLLLREFCAYADHCNNHLEGILVDSSIQKGGYFCLRECST